MTRPLRPAAAAVLRRRIGALLAYRLLSRAGVVWPVLVPFYRGFAGLDEVEVFWLVVVYSAARLLGEAPARWLASHRGHRSSLVLASMASAAGAALVLVGADRLAFTIGELLLGLGGAARRVALPGMLAATLVDAGQEEDVPSLERRARSLEIGATIAGMLLSGLLLSGPAAGLYLWCLTTHAATLASALLLDEPASLAIQPAALGVRSALREMIGSPALCGAILVGGLASGLSLAVRLGQQVFLESLGWAAFWLGFVAATTAATARLLLDLESRGYWRPPRAGPRVWLAAGMIPLLGMTVAPHPATVGLLVLRGAVDAARQRSLAATVGDLSAPVARPMMAALAERAAQAGALAGALALALLAGGMGTRAALGALAVLALGLVVLLSVICARPRPPGGEQNSEALVPRTPAAPPAQRGSHTP